MKAKLTNIFIPLFVAVAILIGGAVIPSVFADDGEPLPGSVTKILTYEYYPATTLAITSTVYSSAPRIQTGLDVTHVKDFNSVDVFVTAVVTGTKPITVKPQFSADQTNWSDADYVVHNSSATPVPGAYTLTLSTSGTNHLRVPVTGEYMRFAITAGNGTGSARVSVKATLRNN